MILLSNIKIEGCQQSPVTLQQQLKYVSNKKTVTLLLIQMCLCELQQLTLQLHMSGHMCMYV
jgi:hypothetical protein